MKRFRILVFRIQLKSPEKRCSLISKHSKTVALGTTGLLFGSGLFVATPALAVNGDTCAEDNTFGFAALGSVDSPGALRTELLTGEMELVCVTGIFNLAETLLIDRSVTLRGTGDSRPVFTGSDLDMALVDINTDREVTLENLEFHGTDGVVGQLQAGVVVGDPFDDQPGELTVKDSVFRDFGRGGIASAVDLIIENSRFEGNSVEANLDSGSSASGGGAVFGKNVMITASTFAENSAPDGGAVFGENVMITASTFAENSATDGGAVFGKEVVITASTFAENSATDGGAVFGKNVEITASTFAENSATDGGAVFGKNVEITASTFAENSATDGGAVFADGRVDVLNSTFVSNLATNEGGAIFSSGGGVADFSTFLNNEAAEPVPDGDIPGNAIYITVDEPGGNDFLILASIFAGTSDYPQLGVGGGEPGSSVTTTFGDNGGNIFSTTTELDLDEGEVLSNPSAFGQSVESIFGWDPSLADNGGPTQTLALRAGALAIDFNVDFDLSGVDFGVPDPDEEDFYYDKDQRGFDRGEPFDAGAFEFTLADMTTSSGTSSSGGSFASVPELARTGPSALGLMGLASGLLVALGGAVMALRGRLTRRL